MWIYSARFLNQILAEQGFKWFAGVQLLYRQLLETNTCDERLLTMVFLVVEKLRGEVSPTRDYSVVYL